MDQLGTYGGPTEKHHLRERAVCVTGANGFIGSWIVKTLLDHGHTTIHLSIFPGSDHPSHLFSLPRRHQPGHNLGQNLDFREGFDIAVARAVAEMRVLAEYCLPLVRVGGLFVAAKGHDPQEEVTKAETAIHYFEEILI